MDTIQKPRGQAPARPRPEGAEKKRNTRPPEERPVRRQAEAAPRKRPGEGEPRPKRPAEGEPRRQRPAEGEARPKHPAEGEARPQRPAEGETRPRRRPQEGKTLKKDPKAKRPQRRTREQDDTLSSKHRAYGNSKPKQPSAFSRAAGFVKQSAKRSAAKAKARKEKSGKGHTQVPTPAVIYTEPKAFNQRRFAIQMLTVTAVVAALLLGLSVFFKVETITVSGAEVYSAWSVREASGISEGDSLLSFGNTRACARIKTNLPYVKSVRIGIKLPDTVNIIIEEEDVVYAIKAQDELWWLMTSDGRIVEQTNGGKASSYTQILGVTLDNPIPHEKAIATEIVPAGTQAEGENAPAAVTGAQRLKAALQIVQALEANDIVGDAASVDVSQIENIVLWYGSRYEVRLGDDSRLSDKVNFMNDAILQMSDYQSGILDLSFNIWPDKVVYTPFG